MQQNKKGFCLVEIIVTMVIIVIVIGIVTPLFISNYKTLNETEARNDLQREGQQAMKYISDKAMETTTVQVIGLDDDNASATLGEIEFSTPNIDSRTGKKINYYFTVKDNSLYYQQKFPNENVDHSKDQKIADNIKKIEIQTSDGKKISECNGLNIKITLSKNKIDYTLESQVHFRNVQVSSD